MFTIGQEFEGLRINRILGESFLTTTFLAEKPNKEKVVLKIFKDPAFTKKDALSYLRCPREAITQGKVSNQAYLSFYKTLGTAEIPMIGKRTYLIRGYVEGQNLAGWSKCQRSWTEKTNILRKISQGLNHLHMAGMIHGDLCPNNVIVGDGKVKITDFGTGVGFLAPMLKRKEFNQGKFPFLPPWYNDSEKFLRPVTDTYALGAILYFLENGVPSKGIPEDAIQPVKKALMGVYENVGDFLAALELLAEQKEGSIEDDVQPDGKQRADRNQQFENNQNRVFWISELLEKIISWRPNWRWPKWIGLSFGLIVLVFLFHDSIRSRTIAMSNTIIMDFSWFGHLNSKPTPTQKVNITKQLEQITNLMLVQGKYQEALQELNKMKLSFQDNLDIKAFLDDLVKELNVQSELIVPDERETTQGGMVHISSGKGFRLRFVPDDACYIYIFQFDSKNNVVQLFPNLDTTSLQNPLKAGVTYQIPDGDDWFVLDQNTGKETIYFVASKWPSHDLDQLSAKFKEDDDGNDEYRLQFLDRIEARSRVYVDGLKGCFYKEITFQHD